MQGADNAGGGVKRNQPIAKVYEVVPIERIGVVIGPNGSVKERLEKETGTKITIDSNSGIVYIEPRGEIRPENLLKAKEIVRALSIGFTPEEAFRLIDDDEILIVINLKEILGDVNHIRRVKSRIIGEEGRTRKIIEETTGAVVVVGEHDVGIIGDYEQAAIAEQAIRMLIEGKPHAVVYSFLEREARKLKRKRMTNLWK